MWMQKQFSCISAKPVEDSWSGNRVLDAVITPDDVRYFTAETDDIANLETSVMENAQDVQLWIKLTYKYLNQREGYVCVI